MKEENIIDKNSLIYEEIIKEIKEKLSTNKKFINANFTKNNFKLLKTKFPELWEKINHKTIFYNNKAYIFAPKIYKELFINGVNIGSCSWKNKNVVKLVEKANKHNVRTLKELIHICLEDNFCGTRIVVFAKKIFPLEYVKLKKILQICSSEREALYCYATDTKPLFIWNKKVQYITHKEGYSYQNFADVIKNDPPTKDVLLRLFESNISITAIVHFIKAFAPCILEQANAWVEENNIMTDSISEKLHLFAYNKFQKDQCLWCEKTSCEFLNSRAGYRDFCSLQCKSRYNAIKNRKYKDPKDWKSYKRLVNLLTEFTFKKFQNIFETSENQKRGKGKGNLHLDHIVSKLYCFEHQIDPRKVSHWSNLQLLEASLNCKKGANYVSQKDVDKILKLTDDDISYFDEYYRTVAETTS